MLRYMTAGESHGKALMVILDGMPAGMPIDMGAVNGELSRRMKGYGRGKRMDIERDKAELVSGCRKGVTIGSPVSMIIKNADHKIDDMPDVKFPRPGHADLAGIQKYAAGDARDILERASARETAARVAAGAVAKQLLEEFGIKVLSHVTAIGGIKACTEGLSSEEIEEKAEASDLRCADDKAAAEMRAEIDKTAEEGDTLGGEFEVIAAGVPAGLGSYTQWDRRMDAALARAVVSIPAVKAVSLGMGVECASRKGSLTHDEIILDKKDSIYKRASNNAGGTEGGVTNGEDVVVRGYMKPIATLKSPLRSVNIDTGEENAASTERSDVVAVPACAVVAEAVVAIELAGAFLDKFGGDSIPEIKRNYEAYMKTLKV